MAAKTVSILGCGWLGMPLAQRLIELGFNVKGSTTTREKKALLEHKGIQPFLIDCAPEIDGERLDEFFNADTMILTLPFRRKLSDPSYYRTQIQSIIKIAELNSVRQIVFTSSTSVYPESRGLVYEDDAFEPANDRAAVLASVEQELLGNNNFQITVLRLAGLYGENRMIGKFLSGKKDLGDANAPVNLIHVQDCVEIILLLIQRGIWGEVFNLCSDAHPTRRELYTQAARQKGLPEPQFTSEEQTRFKIVSNEKIKKTLNYKFLYADPLVTGA